MPVARAYGAALPVLVAVGTHAVTTGAWQVSLVLAALAVVALLVPRPLARNRHIALALVAATAGVLAALWAAPGPLVPRAGTVDTLARAVATATVAVAIVAVLARARVRSALSPLLPALAGMVAGGMARVSALYFPLVVAFVAAALLALGTDPQSGPRWLRLGTRRTLAFALATLAAAGLAVALILVLPPANQRVTAWVLDWVRLPNASGMSDGIHLRESTDISLSDEVALRVRGEGPELLRGFVLDSYRRGRWARARNATAAPMESSAPTHGPEVEVVPIKPAMQYFLPLGAGSVRLQSGRALRDGLGQWTAPVDEVAGPAWFTPGMPAGLAPPTAADTTLPPELVAPLAEVARDFVGASRSPGARMDRLVARLQTDFTYSLHHRRKTHGDPVLDFLLEQRTGHCEYFASALALLARSLGIPARVVTGYRAHERNPVGGYRVVRERDAHAWVEAFIDGRGWQSYDATPAAYFQATADRTPWLRGFFDWLATPWHEGAALRALLLWALGLAVIGALAVVGLRRLRRRHRSMRGSAGAAVTPPWPALQELERALARRSLVRARAETLEHFGRRLRAAGQAHTAELVDDYARLRYGGHGRREDLEPRLRAEAAALVREPQAP